LLAGDRVKAAQLAEAVVRRPEIAGPADYYAAATAGEALLLCGRIAEAVAGFARACGFANANFGARASTMRQLLLILDEMALGEADREQLLRAVRPPPVIHYCGHMFVAGWQSEAAVVAAVEAILDETQAAVAYGSLACGADIVVAEAVLKRGGEVHLVSPYEEEDFLMTSVTPGGPEWIARYHAVRARATSFTLATRILEQTLGSPVVTALLNVVAAAVAGYIGARIAGTQEITVVGVAAAVETCMLAYGWAAGAYDALPIWMRVLLVVTTGPGMVTGAWIRMQARVTAGDHA